MTLKHTTAIATAAAVNDNAGHPANAQPDGPTVLDLLQEQNRLLRELLAVWRPSVRRTAPPAQEPEAVRAEAEVRLKKAGLL